MVYTQYIMQIKFKNHIHSMTGTAGRYLKEGYRKKAGVYADIFRK